MLVAFFSRDCNSPLCLRRRSLILLSRNSIFLCKISSSYTFGVLTSQPGLINKLTSLQSTIISSLSLVSPISGGRRSWLHLHSKLKKLVLMTWNKCHQKFFWALKLTSPHSLQSASFFCLVTRASKSRTIKKYAAKIHFRSKVHNLLPSETNNKNCTVLLVRVKQ